MREFWIDDGVGRVAAGRDVDRVHRQRITHAGPFADDHRDMTRVGFAPKALDADVIERQAREHRDAVIVDIARVEANFREAFLAAWSGAIENDGFNRLVLAANLGARQIVVLRACCRYLLQTGVPFSQIYMERTLSGNAAITRNLVRLFETRFGAEKLAGGGEFVSVAEGLALIGAG